MDLVFVKQTLTCMLTIVSGCIKGVTVAKAQTVE